LENTILEAFVGLGLVNAVQIQSFDETRPILLVREQVRATSRAAHREQTRIAPARLAIPIVFPRHVAHACTLVPHVMRCTAAVVLNVRRRHAPPRGAEAGLAFAGASGRGWAARSPSIFAPPSTWIAEPVIAPARSEHRNATAKASSSGRGWRLIGCVSRARWALYSGVTPGCVSESRTVSMKPGFTSLTVIPYSPRPAASDFVSVRSAPFAVEGGRRAQPPLYPSGP